MSPFFRQTAQAMIAKHINRFPLLKMDQVIDWQPIKQYLNRQRTRYLRDHRGRPAYPLLSMFKAVLLGQWHSLSDPELEHSLITRIDFNLFCRFDEQCAIKFFVSDFLGTKSLVAVQTSVRPPGFCIACLTSRFVILFYTCLFGNMRFLLYLRADFLIVFLLSFSA